MAVLSLPFFSFFVCHHVNFFLAGIGYLCPFLHSFIFLSFPFLAFPTLALSIQIGSYTHVFFAVMFALFQVVVVPLLYFTRLYFSIFLAFSLSSLPVSRVFSPCSVSVLLDLGYRKSAL